MALTTCEECGNSVSTSASACPHCGATPEHFKKIEVEEEATPEHQHKPYKVGKIGRVFQVIFFGGVGIMILAIVVIAALESDKPEEKESAFTDQEICRALIAAVFGRPLEIMNVENEKNGVFYISYTRPDDGSFWENKCRVDDGENVTWGSKDGRWRTDPRDLKTTYSIDGDSITIDEGGMTHTYSEDEF